MSEDWNLLEDAAFVAAVASATYPGERFGHREHLRLAWCCLREEQGFDGGLRRVRALIQNYAAALGATGKYHETLTRAWMELVHVAMEYTPGARSFEQLLEAHPHLMDAKLLARHYQKQTLDSAEARTAWVAPDVTPLRSPAVRGAP
ncbi:hypothetical protein [Myxococcus sp. AB025B]|uniref:hypothetical protein n=1 Tax=Myxococcus TaxID=32 RepID=UPI00114234B1|nr:hypothetical protein [Myxococcus sp. AB025B]